MSILIVLWLLLEFVEVILSGDLPVFHCVVRPFRPHIQHKADGEKIEVGNGDAKLHAAQEE